MRYWFRPKQFGWGFVPITWEGWGMTGILVVLILLSAFSNNFFSHEEPAINEVIRYVLDIVILTSIFSLIAKEKTKGKLKMRWGKEDTASEHTPVEPK